MGHPCSTKTMRGLCSSDAGNMSQQALPAEQGCRTLDRAPLCKQAGPSQLLILTLTLTLMLMLTLMIMLTMMILMMILMMTLTLMLMLTIMLTMMMTTNLVMQRQQGQHQRPDGGAVL